MSLYADEHSEWLSADPRKDHSMTQAEYQACGWEWMSRYPLLKDEQKPRYGHWPNKAKESQDEQ